MKAPQFTDEIRKAIDDCGLSRYAICKLAKVDQGNFSKFMAGGGLSFETLDRVAKSIGLHARIIKPRKAGNR